MLHPDLDTLFNFIATNDVVVDNSGSPIINEKSEIVELSLTSILRAYSAILFLHLQRYRCVGVHLSEMIEAIRDMYKATRLSDELLQW